jgi:hypothetical protein
MPGKSRWVVSAESLRIADMSTAALNGNNPLQVIGVFWKRTSNIKRISNRGGILEERKVQIKGARSADSAR